MSCFDQTMNLLNLGWWLYYGQPVRFLRKLEQAQTARVWLSCWIRSTTPEETLKLKTMSTVTH